MRCLRVSSTLGTAQAVGTNASGRAFSSHACGADAAPPDGRGILRDGDQGGRSRRGANPALRHQLGPAWHQLTWPELSLATTSSIPCIRLRTFDWRSSPASVGVETSPSTPHTGFTRTTECARARPPSGVVTTMAGGPFDGARFVHSYTPTGQDRGRFRVDRRLQTAQTA